MLSVDKSDETGENDLLTRLASVPSSDIVAVSGAGSCSSPSSQRASTIAANVSSSIIQPVVSSAQPENSADKVEVLQFATNPATVEEVTPNSAAPPPLKRIRAEGATNDSTDQDVIAAAAEVAVPHIEASVSPYINLQRAVHAALESKAPALTTSDKVALALEVLRARQLELDLAQARNNIEALVTKSGSAPRTLRSVIPSSTVKGLPIGTPIEINAGKFLLSPTTNDPQALFLTLELQNFGERTRDMHQNDLAPCLNSANINTDARHSTRTQENGQVMPSDQSAYNRNGMNTTGTSREVRSSIDSHTPARFQTTSASDSRPSGHAGGEAAGPSSAPIPNSSGCIVDSGSSHTDHMSAHPSLGD